MIMRSLPVFFLFAVCHPSLLREQQQVVVLAQQVQPQEPLVVRTVDADIYSLSAGHYHTCAIEYRQGVDIGGGLRCWGQNTYGQARPPPGVFRQVSSGHSFSCAISLDSKVKCWGDIRGTPPLESSSSEQRKKNNNNHFKSVSSGKSHACGLTMNGNIQCWGRNMFGEATSPPPTPASENMPFVQVVCADSITCGLLRNGKVKCWGKLFQGPAEEIKSDEKFIQISAGKRYKVCGITASSGDVRCWGSTSGSSSRGQQEKKRFCDAALEHQQEQQQGKDNDHVPFRF